MAISDPDCHGIWSVTRKCTFHFVVLSTVIMEAALEILQCCISLDTITIMAPTPTFTTLHLVHHISKVMVLNVRALNVTFLKDQ